MKVKRQFNWDELLGNKAWRAIEIADKLGMQIMTCRRYLRMAAAAGRLIILKYGRYKYYVTRNALCKYNCPDKEECQQENCKDCECKKCYDILKEKGFL